MPIEVITGIPGHGKTLLLMERLHREAAAANRPLFVAGVDNLAPGLANVLEDPREWNAVDPEGHGELCKVQNCSGGSAPHTHKIPDGSLIFVDEAWKWFGHLQDAARQATPKHVLQLAEHRHRGIDFVWTTQQSNQIYPFSRGLVGAHQHIVRKFGTHVADVYTWGALCDDVTSEGKRATGLKRVWKYPKHLFASYTSATQHTIKRRIPTRVFALPILAILVPVALFFAYQHIKQTGQKPVAAGGGEAAAASLAPVPAPAAHVLTADEYRNRSVPRFAAEPWSAPLYDDRKPTTDPQILCVISGTGTDSTCHCYTEQATPYKGAALTPEQCRMFATEGIYNPYREKHEQQVHPYLSPTLPGRKADTAVSVDPQTATEWLGKPYKAQTMTFDGLGHR